jgi:hypothetical protein
VGAVGAVVGRLVMEKCVVVGLLVVALVVKEVLIVVVTDAVAVL